MVTVSTTITIDTTPEEAAKVMLNNKISYLLVVDDDKLIGITTESDFMKLLIQLLTDSTS
jgi:CBS domain-containing protein